MNLAPIRAEHRARWNAAAQTPRETSQQQADRLLAEDRELRLALRAEAAAGGRS
jgi:hypothetical protein